MKALTLFVRYRFPLGILLLIGGIAMGITVGWWEATIILFLAAVCLVSHFMLGPMRLVQDAVEAGDIEGAQRILNSIKFPQLLYKPIRSAYHMMQSNLAMSNQDLDKAEHSIRESIKAGSPLKDQEGMQYMQLGAIALQKGDVKSADANLRKALRLGLPDKENKAAALLQLTSIAMNRREFKVAKDFFRRAKAEKPTTKEIVAQIKEIDKYISRMPG